MCLGYPNSRNGEMGDSVSQQNVEEVGEVEDDLFRVGASCDVMDLLQEQEDAYLCVRQLGEPLTKHLQCFAVQALQRLIFALPRCFSELLHVFNLSLSILGDIDASLVLSGPASANSALHEEDVLRTCMVIAKLCLKQASSETRQETEHRLQQRKTLRGQDWLACTHDDARACEEEVKLIAAVKWRTWRPTAAVWLTIFQARLMAIKGKDPLVQQWCDVSLRSLVMVPLEDVARRPPRHLAASLFAGTATVLKLEQELVGSFKFVTGIDISAFTNIHHQL
eukprot:TRINITY_DN8369_c0_g2_i1.p1 TRINITY_DN8369_c0_g2~~TRINITY_DN8369_c0_g2_i1.p1  ORF type:complete len:280 (+),score=56.23 TRINITY_DN8369_c0_g2_i1:50-889(+)